MGSSVPEWPTFFVCRARRTNATASWEVRPCGLSMRRRPSGAGAAGLVRHGSTGSPRSARTSRSTVPGGAVLRGVAGRQPVPAASEGGGHRGQVVFAARAHAHLEPPVPLLLDDGRHVHLARGADGVDEIVRLGRQHAGAQQIRLRQVGPHEVRRGLICQAVQRRATSRMYSIRLSS